MMRRSQSGRSAGLLVAGAIAFLAPSAPGIINPNFTPADLVREASLVAVLTLSAPEDEGAPVIRAEVVETLVNRLKGDPPAPKGELAFAVGHEGEEGELTREKARLAFAGRKTAYAVLLVSGVSGAGEDAPAGCLQIGASWFSVVRKEGGWCLTGDRDDALAAIWAGSARMLAEAARYVLADPTAWFPVRSDLTWGSDLGLGKVEGRAQGCLVADFGPPSRECVIVLSDGGDRVFEAGSQGGPPTDVTGRLKLATKSRLAAVGDFDGDGRPDLASWDGSDLKLALQGPDGTFAVGPRAVRPVKLDGCLSLDALDEGRGAGLVAGTAKGPVYLAPDGKGSFEAAPLRGGSGPAVEDLGPGGVCVVADLDADGRPDVMELRSRGTVLYRGEAPQGPGSEGGRFGAPVKAEVRLVPNPRACALGDYDGDGRLDLMVGGEDGVCLLSRTESSTLENNTFLTGELDYHGNPNRPIVIGVSTFDVNGDGRQGVALFYRGRKPMFFFNRGFACFGLAWGLDLANPGGGLAPPVGVLPGETAVTLTAAPVLQQGTAAGAVWDLNGDGAQDLLGVTAEGEVCAAFGAAADRTPLGLTMVLPPKTPGPVTVAVSDGRRRLGMYVVRPGAPAFAGQANPGPRVIEWRGPDGKAVTRRVVVTALARVEIGGLEVRRPEGGVRGAEGETGAVPPSRLMGATGGTEDGGPKTGLAAPRGRGDLCAAGEGRAVAVSTPPSPLPRRAEGWMSRESLFILCVAVGLVAAAGGLGLWVAFRRPRRGARR